MSGNRLDYQSRLKPEFRALHAAIAAGDLTAFQKAMEENKAWNSQTTITTSDEDIMKIAIIHGKIDLVNFLLARELAKDPVGHHQACGKAIGYYLACAREFKGDIPAQNTVTSGLLRLKLNQDQENARLFALGVVYKLYNNAERVKMVETRMKHFDQANQAAQVYKDYDRSFDDKFIEFKALSSAKDFIAQMRFYRSAVLRAEAANLGCNTEYDTMATVALNHEDQYTYESQILACHFLSESPFVSQEYKSACQETLKKYDLFYQGLCSLFGLKGHEVNFSHAIKLLDQFIQKIPDKKEEIAKSACMIRMQALIGRFLEESNPGTRSQNLTVVMHELEELTFDTNSKIQAEILFSALIRLSGDADKNQQAALLNMYIDRYRYLFSNRNYSLGFYDKIFNSVVTLPIIKTNRDLCKNLVGSLVFCHQSSKDESKKSLAIKQLETLAQQVVEASYQFDVKRALAECYATYNDSISLKKSIDYYESLTKLENVQEKTDPGKLREVYKRYADIVKFNDREASLAAYRKAAELGDETVLKDIYQLDEKSRSDTLNQFEKKFHKANEKTIMPLMTEFMSLANQSHVFETPQVKTMILGAFKKHGRVLARLTLKEITSFGFSNDLTADIIESVIGSLRLHEKKTWIKYGKDFLQKHKMWDRLRKLGYFEIFENKSTSDAVEAGIAYCARETSDLILEHFKNFLLSSINSKTFTLDHLRALMKRNDLAKMQQTLLPFLREHLFMFLETLESGTTEYRSTLILLQNVVCFLGGAKFSEKPDEIESNEEGFLRVNEMLLADKHSTEKDIKALLTNLRLLVKNTLSNRIKERAMRLILEKNPGFFREETDRDLLAVGVKLNHPEAIYQLSKGYEKHGADLVGVILYLNTKFILSTLNQPGYMNAVKKAEDYLKKIASFNSSFEQTAKFYQQVIAQFRAAKKPEDNLDIDAVIIQDVAILDMGVKVKEQVTKGIQTAMQVDDQWIKAKEAPAPRENKKEVGVKPVLHAPQETKEEITVEAVRPPPFNPAFDPASQPVPITQERMYPVIPRVIHHTGLPSAPSLVSEYCRSVSDSCIDSKQDAPVLVGVRTCFVSKEDQEVIVGAVNPALTDEALQERLNKLNEGSVSPHRKLSLIQPQAAPKQDNKPEKVPARVATLVC